MILLLVPVLCAAVGLILYAGLRATGAFGVFAESPSSRGTTTSRASAPSSWRERIRDISPGWLIGVIAVSGIWIVGWLIVLAIGLSLLS